MMSNVSTPAISTGRASEKLPPLLPATMIWQPFFLWAPFWQRVKYILLHLSFINGVPSLAVVFTFSLSSASTGVLQSPLRSCFEVKKSANSCPVMPSFSLPVAASRVEVKMISL